MPRKDDMVVDDYPMGTINNQAPGRTVVVVGSRAGIDDLLPSTASLDWCEPILASGRKHLYCCTEKSDFLR